MNIFKRLFKMGQAEANSAIDNMEDPIKLTEQGIRDLRVDLEKNLEALAQVKALAIRANNDHDDYKSKAEEYKNKAVLLLKKAQRGEMETAEAERLAKEALVLKEEATQKAAFSKTESDNLKNSVAQLEGNISQIKSSISNWENELRTLKARVKVSKAKSTLNKQMAELDSTGTVAMLERMKDKVAQEEALAEAYGDIAGNNKSIDDEINSAVDVTEANAESELDALKKELGLEDDKQA